MKAKQKSFADESNDFNDYWKVTGRKVHGGAYALGKRKTKRPFDSKKPIHIVMRSLRAKGSWSLRGFGVKSKIDKYIETYAQKFNITLYKVSINSNHIHILVRAKEKKNLSQFLKSSAGHIARLVTGAKKNNPKGKFWDSLTFTRIGDWGRAYMNLKNYVIKNILEASGVIPYTPRKIKPAPA